MLVTEEGRKNYATGRVSGRALDGRLVHVAVGAASVSRRATCVTSGSPTPLRTTWSPTARCSTIGGGAVPS